MVSKPNLANDECSAPSRRTRQAKRVHFDESSDSIDGSAAMRTDATDTPSGLGSSNEAATTPKWVR